MNKLIKIFILFLLLIYFYVSYFIDSIKAKEIELINDPNFSKGIANGFANNYPNYLDENCIERWRNILSSYNDLKWMFWEISERFYFCDNVNTPTINSYSINYISPNYGGKKFTIDRQTGIIRMEYNTLLEWRAGCNLCKPWTFDNITHYPRYGDALTNWPHFLVGQVLSPSYSPNLYNISIPNSEKIFLNKYEKLLFKGEFKWNSSVRLKSFDCPDGDWKPNTCSSEFCQNNCEHIPDHAIFYVAFVLWYKNWPDYPSFGPRVVYQLLPLVYTEDGNNNIGGDNQNIVPDQFGDSTFFSKFGVNSTKNVRKLTKNEWVRIDVDVKVFSKEVLNYINSQLSPNDYFISMVLVGWEIWGGYQTDIEFRNLSLKAVPFWNDLNYDGQFNSQDIKIFLSYYHNFKFNHEADFNFDNLINVIDFGLLIKKSG